MNVLKIVFMRYSCHSDGIGRDQFKESLALITRRVLFSRKSLAK